MSHIAWGSHCRNGFRRYQEAGIGQCPVPIKAGLILLANQGGTAG